MWPNIRVRYSSWADRLAEKRELDRKRRDRLNQLRQGHTKPLPRWKEAR